MNESQQRPEQAPPSPETVPDKYARTWAMLCHLSALTIYLGVPFGNIIGPLVIWLITREDDPLIDREGKSALNFQLTIWIATLLCVPLVFLCIGIVMIAVLHVANIIFVVVATITTAGGGAYRYPYSLELIK